MEHCDGGDLQQLIRRCRKSQDYIAEDFIWKVLTQTVSALYHCHRRTEKTKINNGISKNENAENLLEKESELTSSKMP
jgi:serine/threonine protein kinase